MKIKLLLIAIFTSQIAFSQTTVPGGIVNGIWTLAGSPYNIQGSIQIINGDSLIIQPGVTVSFQGTYKLLVLGKLKAIGTITDTIIFTAANTSTGWRGIRFDNTPATNDTSRIKYCKIQYGRASGGTAPDQVGGGVYFNNFSKAVVSYSRIVNCTADGGGGGIYSTGSSPIIANNTISNNNGSGSGGGIHCSVGSPSIINNTISYNNVAGAGGGVSCSSGIPNISHNIISHNNATTTGGGIYCAGANPIITNNTLTYNSSSNAGGGIHSYEATISNNTISNNTSKYGGGIDCTSSTIITNNTISNNTANETIGSVTAYGGGGIYFRGNGGGGNPTITKNTISNNTSATSGGGVNISSVTGPGPAVDTITIADNHISNNTSISSGGGINIARQGGFSSDPASIISVTNNTITNNGASSPTAGGGAIYCRRVIPTLTNNTIANNKASMGGGLYCDNSSPIFRNCILRGNTDSISGPQVFLYDEPSDPNFYYCDIQGGSAAFELNGNFYTGTYQNNIDTNALFVSPSGGSGTGFNGITADWSLQAGSPCIDTGDPNGTYSTFDIAGNPRVSGGRIDIGAYEFQVPAGIAANKNSSTISIYPNPSSGKFIFQSTKENIIKIEIYNLLGSTIYTQNVNHQTVNEIDLSGSPKGIYFAKLYNEEKSFTKKIVIE